jgi:CHAT domain
VESSQPARADNALNGGEEAVDNGGRRCDARDVPSPLRRVLSAWWFYAISAVVASAWFAPALGHTRTGPTALEAVVVVALLGAPYFNLWRLARTNDWSYARDVKGWFYPLAAAGAIPIACAILGMWPPGAVPGLLVLLAAVYVATSTFMRRVHATLPDRVLRVSKPEHAEELATLCHEALADDDLLEKRRGALQLSLAQAMIVLSRQPGWEDVLPMAFDVLDEALGAVSPRQAHLVAVQLASAVDVKHDRTGDVTGLDESIDVMMFLAERAAPDVPTAMASAYATRGQSLLRRGRRAERDGDEERADRLRRDALADLRAAVDTAPERSDERALHQLALAAAEGPRPMDGTLDERIDECRRALRWLWLTGSEERMPGYFVLADLLELRARLMPERAVTDLALALRLCFKLGSGEHAVAARRRVPGLLARLRAALGGVRLVDPSSWLFRRLLARDPAAVDDAAEIAMAWAKWAMERRDARQAADAWQAWLTVETRDLGQRVHDDKQRRLPPIQAQVALAAWWMIAAGRPREAAVALETGRAVLLTEQIWRRGPAIEARLRDAGHLEHAEAWRTVTAALDQERRAFVGTAARGDATPYASAEYLALLDHDHLRRLIGELPGFEDVGTEITYPDIAAAAATGPLVYVGSTAEGGYALVVSADADTPAVVELPALDANAVADHVDAIRAARHPFEADRALRVMLPALWETAIGPIAPHLPVASLVTLVPVGALVELPLHAAATVLDDGIWHDRLDGVAFRYAPNARVLKAAAEHARGRSEDDREELLTAAVPSAPGERELRHATTESAHLAEMFGAGAAHRPQPATVEAVTALLDRCSIWHLACHGRHDPASPLDSCLLLADGPLTLGAILGRRGGRQRLAVLSACQTALIDQRMPDEVLGFPSAMLEVGVAGVLSCQGDVEDAGAMLLVLRFFQLLADGIAPPHAFAAAQAWLRSSTNDGLMMAYPSAYERPPNAPPSWGTDLRFAAPSTWALFNYTGV